MTYIPPHIQRQYPSLPPSSLINIAAQTPVGPGPPPFPGPLQADVGAIAYDPDSGRFGWSWGFTNVEDAQHRALVSVLPHDLPARLAAGEPCPNAACLVWGSGVLALAQAPSGALGYAWGRNVRSVKKAALKNCLRNDRGGILVLVFNTLVGTNLA